MSFASEAFAERPFSSLFRAGVLFFGDGSLTVTRNFRIFAATEEFVTLPTDSLPSQPFFGTLMQPVTFTRSLLGSNTIGSFTSANGELDLMNTDGGYDFLIQRFAIDGRDITVKIGREGDSYDSFYTIFSGTASDWTVQEDIVKILLADNSYKLQVTAQPNLYGGTGGTDGTTDLLGKRKPRAFGTVLNVSPPLVIPSSLLYQMHDGFASHVSAVYDRGVALTQGVNYGTVALLLAASTLPGTFDTCLLFGYLKLGSTPTGTVTCDVAGDSLGGVFAGTASQIVRRIVSTTSAIGDPSGMYLPAFDAVQAAQPAQIGYWIGPDDTSTVADVIANIMGGIGGWAGFRRSGKLEVGIFQSPVGVTPNAFFDKTDVIQIQRQALPTSLSPPPYRFRVAYQHNWTTQTDLAGSVPAARTSFLAQSDRYSESSNTTVLIDHPFAQDTTPIASYFTAQADAQFESDRLLALYIGNAAIYRFTVGILPFALDLGDVVNLTYPRWDLTVGRALRIVEMTENAQANTIEVVGYG
jgi:hypothetical protein